MGKKIKWWLICILLICSIIGAAGYGINYGKEKLTEISYMLRPLNGVNRTVRNKITGFYAEQEDTLDVIVLGSSAVYRYVNNPYLWNEAGITSYNFGTPGLSIYTMEYLIDEVYETQNPELIILDARKFVLTENKKWKQDRFEQLVNSLNYSENRRNIIDKFVKDKEERFRWYFDALLYKENWEMLPEDAKEYADNKRISELKGWANNVAVKPISEIDVTGIEDEVPLSKAAESCLRSLMAKCKKENIDVLFLATPWKGNDDYQRESNYMKRIVEEEGFAYLDMNPLADEIGMDCTSDFYNTRHVNSFGAKKVTSYLSKYLKENYSFKTEYSEEVKASWDMAYQISEANLERMVKRNK